MWQFFVLQQCDNFLFSLHFFYLVLSANFGGLFQCFCFVWCVVCFSVFTLHGVHFATTFLLCVMCILLRFLVVCCIEVKFSPCTRSYKEQTIMQPFCFVFAISSNLNNFLLGLCCYLFSGFTMRKWGDLQLALQLRF